MADRKISELTNITGANLADDDEFALVDTSADETKAITFGEFKTALDTATGFVRITGDTMTGDLSMGDNNKIIMGAGSDLQLYHSGSHSVIKDAGDGNLQLIANDFQLRNGADNANMMTGANGGAVTLMHNGSSKLATTSTGIDVTGTVTADGLTVENTSGATLNINTNLTGADSKILLHEGSTASPANGASIRYAGATNEFSIGVGSSVDTKRISIARDTGDISFYEDTGTTPKFFWDASAESLGIGTSSPYANLHSVGTIKVATGNAQGILALGEGNGTAVNVGLWRGAANAPTTDGNFLNLGGYEGMVFATGAAAIGSQTEAMRIDASGRVGIGITPAAVADNTGADSLQLGGTFLIHYDEDGPGTTTLGNNIYYNGTANKALFTGATSQYYQAAGTHVWRNSGSTSAGSTTTMSESMRLDASGNLLVGKPSTAFGTDGTHINNSGYLEVTNTSGELLYLNRLSNDGDLIRLFKDSAQVGSIGTVSSGLLVGSTDSALYFHTDNNIYPYNPSTSAYRNGDVDLGWSSGRFKDLYLSGTIEIENGSGNVGVGKEALNSNTSNHNTAVGYRAAYTNSSGSANTALGLQALYTNSSGANNTSVGLNSMYLNVSGSHNTAIGRDALHSNTASYNTAVGYQALYNSTGGYSTALGYKAGFSSAGSDDQTFIGYQSGLNTTGTDNTFVGASSGWSVTIGAKNTILGRYSGNQGGLDIRTSSNNIVLSDGDGNPRIHVDNGGKTKFATVDGGQASGDGVKLPAHGACWVVNNGSTGGGDGFSYYNGTAGAYRFYVTSAGQIYATNTSISAISDQRLKENVRDLDVGLDEVLALRPRTFDWKAGKGKDQANDRGFIAQEVEQVFPDLVDEWKDEAPEGEEPYKSVRQDLIPVLVKAIQELSAKNDALEARITALENA